MRGARLVGVVLAASLMAGCLPCGVASFCPAPSSAYQRVEGLPSTERDVVLMAMSVDERLDAYHDVYIRSGHPRRMLTPIFKGSAEATFDAAMARMTDQASFIEYFWIIHYLALNDGLDVCDSRRFGPLSEKALRFHIADPKHPVPIQFDGCVLPL